MKKNMNESKSLRTEVVFVMEQPRDYRKLSAIADTFDYPHKIYVVDDTYSNGKFAQDCIDFLNKCNVRYEIASDVLSSGFQFPLGIYETLGQWRKTNKRNRKEFILVWLWRRRREIKYPLQAVREIFTEAFGASADSSLQRLRVDKDNSRLNILKGVNLKIKKMTKVGKCLIEALFPPVPLARDLSWISVLAPPYADNVLPTFPEAHVKADFSYYLTSNEQQFNAVSESVGEKAVVVGYPQYWSAKAMKHARERLRIALDIKKSSRVIAWLPSPSEDLIRQIDFLRPLAERYTIVLQPHPDMYFETDNGYLDEVQKHAEVCGMLVQNRITISAGLLTKGADLTIVQGISSLVSSLYLGANVVIGLYPLTQRQEWWLEKNVESGLVRPITINCSVMSGNALFNLLEQSSWWVQVEHASQSNRRVLFGDDIPPDLARKRCAATLGHLATRAGLKVGFE